MSQEEISNLASSIKNGQASPTTLYEVGEAKALRDRSLVGDNLEVHHVTQAHPSKQLIPEYNPDTGGAIVLTRAEHKAIPTLKGTVDMSPRDLLARDIKLLRKYTQAPNEKLQELINFNKKTNPGFFGK